MSQILNVTTTDDGKHQVSDRSGHMVEGPFATNGEAWAALDRLTNDDASRPGKRRGNKKVLWGKPEKKSKKQRRKEKRQAEQQHGKMTPKQEHQMNVNASKAVGWVRTVAAAKFDPVATRAYRDHKLGTFGAASEVRKIDPAQYLAEKAARGEI
ncbi:hypothetical protein [Agrobacterium radiobacter]|uniref:hypothetical protein n=1 Tax=Agrobacterium radiobacter TaxID=362 RepID=UPI001605DB7A|nr:hypothetical protein [Agrobacterium radiobacter]MBB4407078.1 hypothetical protein [Agrobacterium radiobacter]MBB4452718.1 hypothetical protein [Agrobacterium radiobacter]